MTASQFARVFSTRAATENEMIMKKTSIRKKTKTAADDLRKEYLFDYRNAKPNPFALKISSDRNAVVLDPGCRRGFRSSEAVNRLLSSMIAAFSAHLTP